MVSFVVSARHGSVSPALPNNIEVPLASLPSSMDNPGLGIRCLLFPSMGTPDLGLRCPPMSRSMGDLDLGIRCLLARAAFL